MQEYVVPVREVQSCVYGMAVPCPACTASVQVQELQVVRRFFWKCAGLQLFLGLSVILHHTKLQKASARLQHYMLQKMLESFVAHARIRRMVVAVDSTGFVYDQSSYYLHAERDVCEGREIPHKADEAEVWLGNVLPAEQGRNCVLGDQRDAGGKCHVRRC